MKNSNEFGAKALNKTIDKIIGQPGGNVLNCVYSFLPEGCGKTEHCSGCAIRTAVMGIHNTGLPIYKYECYQYIKTSSGPVKMMILISGMKI